NELNILSYVYMGDPSIRLNYPDEYKIITESINESTVLGNDTLRALSIANFKGYVATQQGDIVHDFNGTLNAIVFDKIQRITTLNNDSVQGINKSAGRLTYSD